MPRGGYRPGAGRKPNPNKPKNIAVTKLKPSVPAAPKTEISPAIDPSVWMQMLPEIEEISKRYAMNKAREFTPELNPFRIPEFPDRAKPKDTSLLMAMDDNLQFASTQWGSGIVGGLSAEGLLFLGFTYLSELAQRPEYRMISETIADDATRKWIDFDVTGDEKQQKEERDKDPSGFDERMADPDERKKRVGQAGKTDKVKALKDDQLRLEVQQRFYEQARNDGFFGRSHLFIDLGTEDPEELKSDIGTGRDETSKTKCQPGMFKALRTIEPVWTYPLSYNAINPLREDWYNPQVWYVMGRELHGSRLRTFIGHPVPDMLKPAYAFGGLSLSQMAKPYVDIWLQTRQSVAQLIHSFSVMVLMTDLSTLMQPNSVGPLLARIALFNMLRDNQGTFVVNKNTEDFKNVSASLAGLHELQAQAQEHMACLVAGTLIETDRGQISIEEVTLEDQVLTRAGFHPIKWVGVTGQTDTLIEIEAGGSVIAATKDHPIWSESAQEFVDAENVSRSHRLLKSTSAGNMGRQLSGAVDGGGKRKPVITEIKKLAACFIESCGKPTAALSRMAMKFTTLMTMVQTTIGTISNCSLVLNIWPATSAPTNGSMLGAVRLAEINSRAPSRGRCFVRDHAKLKHAEFATDGSQLLTKALASNVESRSPPNAQTPGFALAPACSVAVSRVSEIKVPLQPVYNIEVDGPHEFFANGILVHNSVSRIPLVKFTGIQPAGLNACLPADTLILTDRGQVPIRDVTLSDKVMTRSGLAPLTFSGITKHATELIEIKTATTSLRCTGNHPIWLPSTNEFVPAENVRHGDLLLLIGEKSGAQKTGPQWLGAGNGGGKTPTDILSRGTELPSERFSSIGRFGRLIEGLFLTAFTSITSTAIKKTINSPILRRCTESFTRSIMGSNLALAAGSPVQKRGAASNAERRLSSSSFQVEKSFAVAIAHSHSEGQPAHLWRSLPRSVLALCAERLSSHVERTLSFALGNAQARAKTDPDISAHTIAPTLRNIDAHQREMLAVESVVSVRKIPANEPVYDLTVESGHLPEFFANGILTHNSSEGEIKVYDDTISAYQNRFYRPNLQRVINFEHLSLFGEVDPEITWRFEQLRELTEAEKGQKQKDEADTRDKYVAMGAFAPAEIRKIAIDDPDLPFTGLDPEDVPDLLEEEQEGLEPEGGRPQPIVGGGEKEPGAEE